MNCLFRLLLSTALLLIFCRDILTAQARYSVIDLGTLGGSYSRAIAINDSGLIVGVSSLSNGVQHAFLYQNGTMKDLGQLPSVSAGRAMVKRPSTSDAISPITGKLLLLDPLGGGGSSALGVNNVAQIVGYSQVGSIIPGHAFLYENSTMNDIGTLEGSTGVSVATAINDSGYIVGYSNVGITTHAFRYRNGNWTDLGTIGYVYSFGYAINRGGIIVGVSTRADSIETSFRYENGTMVDIGTLPGGLSSGAYGINNAGTIVGQSSLPVSGEHAYVFRNGVMTDLGSLGTLSSAEGINDSEQIVGWTNLLQSGPEHAVLWEDDLLADLNTLIDVGSGWTLQYASAINNKGQIVGYGLHNGLPHAFLLTPPMIEIKRPAAAELWIAGETDTITWKSNGIISVDILLSTNYSDGAGAFNEIVHGYPADSGRYIWHLPDTILSRKCAIQIEDTNFPDTFAISDSFKIKTYILTRVDSNGDYVPYKIGPTIGEDDWAFNNSTPNMFPPSWYSQFDYVNGTDPFTHSHYAFDFQSWLVHGQPSNFPDWPTFVRVFGTDQCYFTLNFGGLLKPMAILYWALIKSNWAGSCYGFASSSLLAFDRKSDFISRFGMSPFDHLRDVQAGDTARRAINDVFTYQFGSEQKIDFLQAPVTRPKTTLDEFRQILRSENADNRNLNFWDYTSGAAHTVVPWKLSTRSDHPELVYIQVYDNNFPDMDNLAMQIDTVQNLWSYPTIAPGAAGHGNNRLPDGVMGTANKSIGLLLGMPSSSFMQEANIPLTPSGARIAAAAPVVSIFNSGNASIILRNSAGDSITYNVIDSSLNVGIAGAVPNIPMTGSPHPPIGYDVPADAYSVTMSDFTDSLAYFSAFTSGRVMYEGRSDAAGGQSDEFSYSSGLGVRNPDTSLKKMNFGTVIAEPTLQKQIDVLNCTMIRNDSMQFAPFNNDGFRLVNAGAAKEYDIDLKNFSGSGLLRFTHAHIRLDSNSTHLVSPLWDSIGNGSLKIYVDFGNDGTIDDSVLVDNQVTGVKDRKLGEIPREFALYQNFPNPFNPLATIGYDLPARSRVSLRVYNMLGQVVATLVDETEDAGHRSVEWHAADFASGVYFYQLEAANVSAPATSYTAVRKMALVK